MSSVAFLSDFFDANFSDRRVGRETVEVIRQYVTERMGKIDPYSEGFVDPSSQRDLAIKFHWGHDHRISDDFIIKGRMESRHIYILAQFIDQLGLERDLTGKRVLDIGCWTGGMSLLLAGLGAQVIAVDEVRKYVEIVNFLARQFGVQDRLIGVASSLFEFLPRYADHFDIIMYAGVVYHVTDPVLSLRHIFSALKDGGRCFVETHGVAHPDSLCLYAGSRVFHSGSAEELNRSGWNYFVPSQSCLDGWCRDAGFQEVRHIPVSPELPVSSEERLYCVAQRQEFQDLLRAGLSQPNTR